MNRKNQSKKIMSNIQALDVKKLRQQTGAGIMDCKQALQASDNNFDKAKDWLKKKGLSLAAKKSGRKTIEGIVASYIHGNGRIGVLLEVNSETDFVARNEDFKTFVKELSLHIAAMQPLYLKEGDIPEAVKQKESLIFQEQALSKAKNKETADRIAEGLYNKWLQEVCLLKQEFVRESANQKQTVEQTLQDLIARVGENILIRRFACFILGETEEKSSAPVSEEREKTKEGS